MNPGERVVAIRNVEDHTVYYFGYGIYEGDFPRPDMPAQPESWLLEMGFSDPEIRWQKMWLNPRIKLGGNFGDDGLYCWGFECWWGPEEKTVALYPKDAYSWILVEPVFGTKE